MGVCLCVHRHGYISSPKLKTSFPSVLLYERGKSHWMNLPYFPSRALMIVFAFALILSKLPLLLLRLRLHIVEWAPAPWEPQFSVHGSCGICFCFEAVVTKPRVKVAYSREKWAEISLYHDTGGALGPFQLLPVSWDTEKWAGCFTVLFASVSLPLYLFPSQIFAGRE